MAAKGQTCHEGVKFSVRRYPVSYTFEKAKGTTLLIQKFPHNLASFPHNHPFLLYNIAENSHIIFPFFPHPIRWPAFRCQWVKLTYVPLPWQHQYIEAGL